MKKLTTKSSMLFLILTITACGGGGGGGPAPAPKPTKAIVKLMISGTLTSLIGGIDIKIPLPADVSVKATADAVNASVLVTDSGVVTASGASAGASTMATGTYTASSNTLAINVINPEGFGTGEFVTVNLDLGAGATVTASDFPTTTLTAVDLDGAVIAGLTTGMTVVLQ